MNILVVDDSVTIRKIVRSYLESIGEYKILEAADGLEALEIIKQIRNIFLVITDINMPEMNGLKFAYEVKRDKNYETVNFIFMTTETTKEHLMEAMRLGAISFLRKPLVAETFLNTVKKVIFDYENNIVLLSEGEKKAFLKDIVECSSAIKVNNGQMVISKNNRTMEIPLSRVRFTKVNKDK